MSSICAAVKTSTTIGTSCALASVLVAVTITSSIPPESCDKRNKGIAIKDMHKDNCLISFICKLPINLNEL